MWQKLRNLKEKSIKKDFFLTIAARSNILEENWSAEENPKIPEPGERTRAYKTDDEEAITHAREGDWVVTRVERFASFDTDTRIVVCYCKYQPVEPQWEEVPRGASAKELLDAVEV